MSMKCIATGLLCSSLCAACGSADTGHSSQNAPAATESNAKARSACDLISAEEATQIIGSAVVAKETARDSSSSSCYYAPGPGDAQEFMLKVQWTAGQEAWNMNNAGTTLAGKLMGADRDEAAAGVMKTEAVPLGDKSSYSPILGGYVLKGDVLLEFNNLIRLKDPRAKWEELARIALTRIG